jgi:hypothetical protein
VKPEKPKIAIASTAASPEMESSVYDFDTDPEDTPESPFRRKREEASPSSAHKHGSVAVQINFEDKSGGKRVENAADGSSDRLFFIPIQPGVSINQQIQGVEVKVGTEGPNQRVVMQAKLVTNTPGKFAAPLNATGLVR